MNLSDFIKTEAPVRHNFYSSRPREQTFSLPLPLIYYITKNASADTYKKLTHSCRYFFARNRMVIADQLIRKRTENTWKHFDALINSGEKPTKLWVTAAVINLTSGSLFDTSILLRHTYRCDLKEFCLNKQAITFDEYLILTSSQKVRKVVLSLTTITYEDGSAVPLDVLLSHLPELEAFDYVSESSKTALTSGTAEEMAKLPTLKKCTLFRLDNIPQSFRIDHFYDFVRNNNFKRMALSTTYPFLGDEENRLFESYLNIYNLFPFAHSKPPFFYFGKMYFHFHDFTDSLP